MHIAIQRDRSAGRVHRSLRLMRGRRGDWFTARQVAHAGVTIYRDRAAHRVYLAGTWFFWRLPHTPVWPRLYDRWNVDKPCKPVQYSDRSECETCGLLWDTGDPEPPHCHAEMDERAHWLVRLAVWTLAGALGLSVWMGLLRAWGWLWS